MKHPIRPLSKPIEFPVITAKNRVVMAPLVTNFASSDDEVTDRQITYYVQRAQGGAGTIVVEASPVLRDARISARQVGSYDDRFIPGLARLAGAIKDSGTVALLQLCHGGPKTLSRSRSRPRSVSAVHITEGDLPQPMGYAELREVRKYFVMAANRARKAGFDGIELHAAHFYLLSASISPYTNKRTDLYGGSLSNRSRLTKEIVQDIKSEVGGDFLVWVRMNACEALDPGLTLEEGQQIAGILAKAGADTIHVSAYTLPINKEIAGEITLRVGALPHHNTPSGPFLEYAAAIKRAVDVPVIAVGKLDDPEFASRALIEEKCDLIALGRQLLCDPNWVLKIQEDREAEIVHCNYCMTCHTAQQRGEEVRCSQNLDLYGAPVYKRNSADR